MQLPPIIVREFKVRSRGAGVFWIRIVAALLGLLACLPMFTMGDYPGRDLGRYGFNSVVTTGFLLCCAACLLTADLLSSERREGTLGLLLLTPVRAFDVVVGKLGSVAIVAVFGLAGLLPILVVPVLAGGVTGTEAFCHGLVLLDLLFLSLSAGLWASARRWESTRAARTAIWFMIWIMLLPAILEAIFRSAQAWTSGIGLVSPLVAIIYASPASKLEWMRFAVSLVAIQALGWWLLVMAAAHLKNTLSKDLEEASEPEQAMDEFVAARPWLARRVPRNVDPIRWLASRQPGARRAIKIAAILSVFPGMSSWLALPLAGASRGNFGSQSFSLVFSLLTMGMVARGASWFLYETRRSGQLELLLTTPCGAQTLLSSQWRAVKGFLKRPFGVAIGIIALMHFTMMLQFLQFGSSSVLWCVPFVNVALGITGLVLALLTVCWLAMFFAARGHTPLATVAWSAGLAAGVPYAMALLVGYGLRGALGTLVVPGSWTMHTASWAGAVVKIIYLAWLLRRTRRRLSGSLVT